MMSPTLAPVIMNIAMTRQYSVITAWIVVTVVSKSATRVLIDTFITDWSSTITNWAVPSAISGVQRIADPVDVPAAAVSAGVVSVIVRSLHSAVKPGCPDERCPSAGWLITLVMSAPNVEECENLTGQIGPSAARQQVSDQARCPAVGSPGAAPPRPPGRAAPPPWRFSGASVAGGSAAQGA